MRDGRKESFLEAFRATGNVIRASKVAGLSRSAHYKFMDDPEYQAEFAAVCAEIRLASKQRASKAVLASIEEDLSQMCRRITALEGKVRKLEAKPPRVRAPRAPEDETTRLLDQIARSLANKPYRKLSEHHQATVREIAERVNAKPPE